MAKDEITGIGMFMPGIAGRKREEFVNRRADERTSESELLKPFPGGSWDVRPRVTKAGASVSAGAPFLAADDGLDIASAMENANNFKRSGFASVDDEILSNGPEPQRFL